MTKAQEDKARAAQNAYRREWYKKNRDKAKAAAKRYWLKKAVAAEQAAAAASAESAGSDAEE